MRIGLLGFGHLGKIHAKCLKETPFELVGIYDPKVTTVPHAELQLFASDKELIKQADALIIAAATPAHYDLARKVMEEGKHCFIEKPITSTLAEAALLAELASKNPQLITQVGFVERFNPAFQYLRDEIGNPRFLEVHRLAQFNERGTEVSVIFDLMIHDLDLLLNIKNVPVKEIKATGVKILTKSLDICNARIEFEDGAVANLTASRMSMKNMRKFRIFQEDAYLSMDLFKKESQIIGISDMSGEATLEFKVGDQTKHINLKSSGILDSNAILQEQLHFYNCIQSKIPTICTIQDACQTSNLAQEIENLALASLDQN